MSEIITNHCIQVEGVDTDIRMTWVITEGGCITLVGNSAVTEGIIDTDPLIAEEIGGEGRHYDFVEPVTTFDMAIELAIAEGDVSRF
jgi:hypothetical protein